MTQAGGPAAINGFLYQIIHHLGWLANVSLSGTLHGEEVKDACLVLEPRHGGDARAETASLYLVEQYKTRNNGTWSLSDIVDVLCGLRKAVPPSCPTNACYRFVTDGRPGRLTPFEKFCDELVLSADPDALDNTERKRFSPGHTATNREFFDHLVVATRAKGEQATADERRVVFHLLSHFEMEFDTNGSTRAAEVEKLLRRYAPNLGEERGIRERLVGVLFEALREGEKRFDPPGIDAMFRYVGLNPERLHRVAGLPETMAALTHRRLARLKYRPDRDIRDIPEWPGDKPVLLITGESGSGKTWQLGRLLDALGQAHQVVTLVPMARNREDLLGQAARDVWQEGLQETTDKSLVSVSHFLRELLDDANSLLLTVAVDDIQDVDLARDLLRQDWNAWGMRLAMSVPSTVAGPLEITDSDFIHVHSVGNFSFIELDRFMGASGRRWVDLPPDLKMLLCNPILAGIFLELPYESVLSAPQSEYEIFERFWQRITAKCLSGDRGIVRALASLALEDGHYPLPRPMWQKIGLTDGSLARLDAAGWLRPNEGGEVEFAHDRLLNWAVAKFLSRQFQCNVLTIADLGAKLANNSGKQDQPIFKRLGYVLMDTFWLLAEDSSNAAALAKIVEQMEGHREFVDFGALYSHLLPTLGQRAVPILLERLNTLTANSGPSYVTKHITESFISLAKQSNVQLTDIAAELLKSSSIDRQNVAIGALTAAPDPECLDRLWEIHQQRLETLEDPKGGARYVDYKASFAALRAGIELEPNWLRNRILVADTEKERVSEFGHLLKRLEHSDAPTIWQEVGNTLIEKVAAGKPRSSLYCIARFGDQSKLEFVLQHLSNSNDFASSAAFYALSLLAPRLAIERLVEVEKFESYLTRNHWLPGLLRVESELTRQRIRELAESEPKGRRRIEDLYNERPNEMDVATFEFLLRSLDRDLHEQLEEAVIGEPHRLGLSLEFLGRIACLELLAVLEAEAGGELERMIAIVGCSRLRTNSNYHDQIRESARRVLLLIGGEGIAVLIKKELESEHYWVRHSGLNWAFVRDDVGIIERLAVIAHRPIPRAANGELETDPYMEFFQATKAIAALGADSVLIEILWANSVAEVPINLAWLRSHYGQMSKLLTEKALRVLQSAAPPEDALLAALVIAWLSRDSDLIPAVRSVLQHAEPEGKVAGYACIALQELGDRSGDFAQLALRLAKTTKNTRWGLNALAGLGGRGLDLLGAWLQSRGATKRNDLDDFVIRLLYAAPATRELSICVAVDRCQHSGYFSDKPYEIAVEVNSPRFREQIFGKAFASRSPIVSEIVRSIEGLAKFDPTRAVDAIKHAFQFHPEVERQLCCLLLRIAPKAAAEKLIEKAIVTERGTLRNAAGRALRRLDPTTVANLVAERMRGAVSVRKAAAELAAWLPIPLLADTLEHLADQDSATEVRHAAISALEHHRQENNIQALLRAFPSASYNRRWGLLVAILDAADPYLLTDSKDPLWLGNILTDGVPAVFAHHAELVLEQRKKKI
ncbi:MAG: AAA family ATPase [Pseudomonadota bacterium]